MRRSTAKQIFFHLGYILPASLGIVMFAIYGSNIYKYYRARRDAKELVEHKPPVCEGSSAQLKIRQNRVDTGVIDSNTCIYELQAGGTSELYVLAWIWSDSVKLAAKNIELTADENIRVSADGEMIGRLKNGTKGVLIQKNQKGSWLLAKFPFDGSGIQPSRPLANAVVTDTTTLGGNGLSLSNFLELGSLGLVGALGALGSVLAVWRTWSK